MSESYDVVIVGAGVVGLSLARELLRREVSVLVVDKEADVGRGASGRNSGVLHPGFSVTPGSLKARLNVEGSRAMRGVCEDLSVPLRECGTLVVAREDDEIPTLHAMCEKGRANGLERIGVIGRDELEELEPRVRGIAALHSADGAIVESLLLVTRLATNVAANGGAFALLSPVEAIVRDGEAWVVSAGGSEVRAAVVVNAAGVGAPEVAALAGLGRWESFPCRGEYLILDKAAVGVPGRMVYPVPPKSGGLGVHFTPTIAGNTLLGPSAEYIPGGFDYSTTGPVLEQLFTEAAWLCPDIDRRDAISSMAGIRAKIAKGSYGEADFVVEETAPGFVGLVGIESPGLSASPAIARMAAGLVLGRLGERPERAGFDPTVRAQQRFEDLDAAGKAARAETDPDDRAVVCRCEQVTRREVLAALRDPVGARTLSAVKARCRAGTGRCQGGFCTPRVVGIMRDELGVAATAITSKGPGSELFPGEAKELLS
ncbi:MAG: NAD(P)/FAD-dependent oxidoreductase [Coriobacteriia bacterium]